MQYTCTVLKELPDFPVGTQFTISTGATAQGDYYCAFPGDHRQSYYPNYKIAKRVIDNPEWVSKKPDPTALKNIACPACGNAHVCLHHQAWWYNDDGCRLTDCAVWAECPCGTTYNIIGTKV